jgi:hypothetical protein
MHVQKQLEAAYYDSQKHEYAQIYSSKFLERPVLTDNSYMCIYTNIILHCIDRCIYHIDTGKIMKIVFSMSGSQPSTFNPIVAEEITVINKL